MRDVESSLVAYILTSLSSVSPRAAVRKGGSLYYEPHVMFNPAELSRKKADVVITPVVSQNIGPYALVAGG